MNHEAGSGIFPRHEGRNCHRDGLWGRYILKPRSDRFACLPENEDNGDLIMHLAEIGRIKTVPHSLIRFADGELCYLTKRIGRTKKGGKLAMDDIPSGRQAANIEKHH